MTEQINGKKVAFLVANEGAALLWGGAADGANRADGYLLRP